MLLTKISNLRDPLDIEAVAALTPTYMGFNFMPLSERYMGEVEASLLHVIPTRVRKSGRFADEHFLRIISVAGRYGLTTVQLDGNESPSQCEQLSAEGLEVLKTITSLSQTESYEGVCNRFIFRMPIDQAERYVGRTPFLFETSQCGLVLSNERCCGVDCAEMLEIAPACKDVAAVVEYIKSYSLL